MSDDSATWPAITATSRPGRCARRSCPSASSIGSSHCSISIQQSPSQSTLEAQYREELGRLFGIEFHQLLTITNMPIKRFATQLAQTRQTDAYMSLLVNHFNPATVAGVMCRSLVSVGWDGQLYDCDFNQMLDIPLGASGSAAGSTGARPIWDIARFDRLTGTRIATGQHCYGCTAGAGSSCSGALM